MRRCRTVELAESQLIRRREYGWKTKVAGAKRNRGFFCQDRFARDVCSLERATDTAPEATGDDSMGRAERKFLSTGGAQRFRYGGLRVRLQCGGNRDIRGSKASRHSIDS